MTSRDPRRFLPHPRPRLLAVLALAWVLLSWFPAAADEELEFGLETHRLAQIEIAGNTTFSDKELKGLLRIQESTWRRPLHVARYRPHLVDTQLRILQAFYRNQGFHQAVVSLDSVTTVEEEGDVLHISVQEGQRTIIARVSFAGNAPLEEDLLRESLHFLEGQPAPADRNALGRDIFLLGDLYRRRAFLVPVIEPEMTITEDPDGEGYLADLVYRILPGNDYRAGSVTLVGNRFTRDNILRREIVVRPGEPVYWGRVEESRRRLLATSLFRDVTIIPAHLDSLMGTADLEVRVVERKPAFYELGVGVGSLERIRLLAAWGHYNLWGTGRRFQLRTRGSWNLEDVVGNPQSFDEGQVNFQIDADYVNPRLRDSRYSMDVNVFMRRDTRGESGLNMLSHGLSLGTTWKASRRVTNNVYLGLKITDPKVHPYAPDDLKERFDEIGAVLSQVRSVNWGIYIDHRDDPFRPSTGMYSVGTLRVAGGPLGGDYSFFKWTAAWHNYFTPPTGGVLALRLLLGGARPYGGSLDQGPDGVPYDERFFAGGGTTVRGYGHNALGPQVADQDELDYLNFSSDVLLPDNPARGGNYLMLTSAEWRFPLPVLDRWKLASVLFFEGGNVWAQMRDVRWRAFRLVSDPGDPTDPGSTKVWDYRYSWGTGVRLDTPFGPVRVDVGFPLKRVRYISDSRDTKDPARIWHFSLGYPF